ncbi:hypothetical protein PQX77_020781 [Marasmius sp. AFHP31]|nr:hypothetical protein PQX77_020781 [Marasmius sp. AFHP31]
MSEYVLLPRREICDSYLTATPQYEYLFDRNERFRNMPIVNQQETKYGQLQHLFTLQFNASSCSALHLDEASEGTLILAVIRSCKVKCEPDSDLQGLDIHSYSNDGALDVVDITTVQCLVGRVKLPDGNDEKWAIIDRSGSLARAIYEEEEEEIG